ncbi:hypothetical protein QQ020_06385 [Fulvivirgaceae bacterium BMA12]|uniref:Response regulatory domain-containing protein n=1 Tax=Agaribacillus aureus TaxID=3051825 RepID=A0ABT8L3Q5_9BACT|nr:hypothetical protein [Fulvivirgaceae bacterium BMA12]
MESINNSDTDPVVYLLADSFLGNLNLRMNLQDCGINDIVSMVNREHLMQALDHQPDIILIDAALNDPEIPYMILEIKARVPKACIVFLIDHEDHMEIINLLRFGAFEFATKDMFFGQKIARIINTVIQLKYKTD